jgi:drug/metabolite transporter (DMT)-like permease
MADITLLQGRASRVSQNATVLRTGTTWQTIQVAQFLIDDTPAKFAGSPHLNEGDGATVVGYDFRPDFRVLAMRNDSTGVEYRAPVVSHIWLAIVCLVLAGLFMAGVAYAVSRLTGKIPGAPLFLGFFFTLPLAILAPTLLMYARTHARANQLLRETPRITAAELSSRLALSAGHGSEHNEEPIDTVLGSLARGTVGVVGLLLALVALIGCAASLTSLSGGSDDRTSSILGLVFCLGVTATGFYLVRFGFGPRLRKRAGQTQLAR